MTNLFSQYDEFRVKYLVEFNMPVIRFGLLYCFYMVFSFSITSSSNNVFHSPHKLEALYLQEKTLMSSLENFITSSRKKLHYLEKKMERLKQTRRTYQSPDEYASHPINALKLIQRLATEWPIILNVVNERTDIGDLPIFSSEKDILSALKSLGWLQKLHALNTEDIASGIVDGHKVESHMTASDCYEMGKTFYKQMDFVLAKSWLTYSLKLISEGDSSETTSKIVPYLYLAESFSECHYPNKPRSVQGVLTQLLAESPDMLLSAELSWDLRQALSRNCSWVNHSTIELINDSKRPGEQFTEMYGPLCRGEVKTPANLSCYYVHYSNPRLLLAPFRLEELHLDPPLVMLHDVISDQEIHDMQTFFKEHMSICVVGDKFTLDPDRICDVSWTWDWESETAARISRRVADMTSLGGDMESCQVARYGLGGEYRPHLDSSGKTEALSPESPNGNRLATVMFYLNDVETGGRTVFPRLKMSVAPKKGSAVFWFNVNHKGEDLQQMLHGGCPVLKGTKWVLNKWIFEKGQDFEKTCPRNTVLPVPRFYLSPSNGK